MIPLGAQVNVAAFSDEQGVAQSLRALGKEGCHLLRTAEVVGVAGHLHAVGVAQQCAGLDGEHDVLVAGIGPFNVMHIIGGDEIGVVALAQVQAGSC